MSVVECENRDGALWVTLNRPDQYNTLCPESICIIMDMWKQAEEDDSVRFVVFTGAGDKAFCAGADLKKLLPILSGMKKPDSEFEKRVASTPDWMNQVTQRNRTFSKPVITIINGTAMGGGTELALASDIRIASSSASFALSEPKVGVVAAGGSMVRLPRQISWCNAMEFLLTGDTITAVEAKEIGLINRVVEPENLHAEAERIISTLQANAPLALQAIKRVATLTSGIELDEAFAIEDAQARKIITTEDAKEGPRAFAEKRRPVFQGK